MENASKALLMAGGILIAILVIGALLLMFNQLGGYQSSQNSATKNAQLAKFNSDFERYLDDKGISGADIVTLANKIIDYNNKEGTVNEATNSVNYSIKMSLKVSNMDSFRRQYAYTNNGDAIFQSPTYTISKDNNNNSFYDALNNYSTHANNKDLLKKLSSIYSKYGNDGEDKMKEILIAENKNLYQNWRLNGNTFPTEKDIINYKEYTEFKTSTFKIAQDPVYENGQIKDLYFKWDN